MDEYTYKGYLAEKQAFEARIAELEAALKAANAHNASLEESRRIARECIRCANDYIKELKAEAAELRGRIGG